MARSPRLRRLVRGSGREKESLGEPVSESLVRRRVLGRSDACAGTCQQGLSAREGVGDAHLPPVLAASTLLLCAVACTGCVQLRLPLLG